MEILPILWIASFVHKMHSNADVYRKQQKDDLYYDDSWILGFTFEGLVFVIFTFWWSKKDMLEDPDLKKDMIWANVSNVLFFSLTAFIVMRWILKLF